MPAGDFSDHGGRAVCVQVGGLPNVNDVKRSEVCEKFVDSHTMPAEDRTTVTKKPLETPESVFGLTKMEEVQVKSNEPVKIYCDGVFDLFHMGHCDHFEKIKKMYPKSHLFVGVMGDEESTSYKRKPIFSEKQREFLVGQCRFVDQCEVLPMKHTKEWFLENNIEKVVHAFANASDVEKQKEYFTIPIELGIFEPIGYNHGISTSDIIANNGWAQVWEKKGTVGTTDLQLLNGYDATSFDPKAAWKQIQTELDIPADANVLEVGCGAGFVAQHIVKDVKNYVGTDLSESLVSKHVQLLGNMVVNFEASSMPFADKSFDYVVLLGVCQYFPDREYTSRVVKEFERLAKKGVYFGAVRHTTHQQRLSKHIYNGPTTHLLHKVAEDFPGYVEKPTFYDPEQYFNVMKKLV